MTSANTAFGGALPTTTLVQPQNPPAPATTVIAKVISGDTRIDPLLDSANYRFNDGSPVGTPVTVTFSFPDEAPSTYSGEDIDGWKSFSEAQKTATREMLDLIQKQVNITFQEVSDSATNFGTMRFSNNIQKDSGGYALLPNSTGTDRDADTWIAISDSSDMGLGTYNWMTLLHEIGHAIGLNHPGNYNAGESANDDAVGNFLGASEDAFFNSIMSYRWSAQSINDIWFMPYDMLALRYVYGMNPFNTGNNSYTLTDSSGAMVQNIVDDGGIDTLNFSAVTTQISLDMTPGAYSSFGRLTSGAPALADLTISFDAIIENAIGTPQNDSMIGNSANNVLTGGVGDDVVDGGAGTDTAVFSVSRAAAAIIKTATGWTVSSPADGTDTLTNVERLQFSDAGLAFDVSASNSAGAIYRLFGATFNRIPDLGGFGYWIDQADKGKSAVTMAIDFTFSEEFQTRFATKINDNYAAGSDVSALVTAFFTNVLHRTPSAVDRDWYADQITSHQKTVGQVIAEISDSPEFIAQLAGVLANGVVYIPFGG